MPTQKKKDGAICDKYDIRKRPCQNKTLLASFYVNFNSKSDVQKR